MFLKLSLNIWTLWESLAPRKATGDNLEFWQHTDLWGLALATTSTTCLLFSFIGVFKIVCFGRAIA